MLINLPSPHPGAPTCPSTLEVLRAREHAPTPYPFIVFTFGLAVKSIQELGGASHGIRVLVDLDPFIGKFRWHQRRPIN